MSTVPFRDAFYRQLWPHSLQTHWRIELSCIITFCYKHPGSEINFSTHNGQLTTVPRPHRTRRDVTDPSRAFCCHDNAHDIMAPHFHTASCRGTSKECVGINTGCLSGVELIHIKCFIGNQPVQFARYNGFAY